MDPQIASALIAAVTAIVTALLALVLPNSQWFTRLVSKRGAHSLVGGWISEWGPLPNGPVTEHENLVITKHIGEQICGYISRDSELEHRWVIEGRYDGRFVQLLYYPSPDCDDPNIISHGCYFFERRGDGSFVGYSTGYGTYDDGGIREGTTTDFHRMSRRRAAK